MMLIGEIHLSRANIRILMWKFYQKRLWASKGSKLSMKLAKELRKIDGILKIRFW